MSSSPSAGWRSVTTEPRAGRLNTLLTGLASDRPVPAGGSAAAAAVAMSAALVEKVATLSLKHWPGAAKARGLAIALRRSAEELVEADALAYTSFVVARRGAQGLGAEGQRVLESAQAQTINVPLATIQAAVETVELASALARFGNPNLRSDATVAGLLAAAAARASVVTIAANLPTGSRDRRLIQARRLARAAGECVRSLPYPKADDAKTHT